MQHQADSIAVAVLDYSANARVSRSPFGFLKLGLQYLRGSLCWTSGIVSSTELDQLEGAHILRQRRALERAELIRNTQK
jgi:hypothetical protein